MKDSFELVVDQDGLLEGIYQDGLAEALGARAVQVCRASNVEWEVVGDTAGWTVRSARDPEWAIRIIIENGQYKRVVGREGDIAVFPNREHALLDEVQFFWALTHKE